MKKFIIVALVLLATTAHAGQQDLLTDQQQYAQLSTTFFNLSHQQMNYAHMSVTMYLFSKNTANLTGVANALQAATSYLSAARYFDSLIVYSAIGGGKSRGIGLEPHIDAAMAEIQQLQAQLESMQ